MKQFFILFLTLTLLALTPAKTHSQSPASTQKPGQYLEIKPAADGKSFTITPKTTQESGWGLIELVNPKTNNVERVLYAGRISRETPVILHVDDKLKPGSYLLRLRDGVSLSYEKNIPRPDAPSGKWICPSVLILHNGCLFIGDSGLAVPEIVAKRSPQLTWATRDGKTVTGICARVEDGNALIIASDPALGVVPVDPEKQTPQLVAVAKDVQQQTADWRLQIKLNIPMIVKLGPDGQPVQNWAEKGFFRNVPNAGSGTMHGVAIDDAGCLYLSNESQILSIGTLGLLEKNGIGAYPGNPPRSLAASGPSKLYIIPYTGYAKLHVADRTKPDSAANLYFISPFRNGSWTTNALAADNDANLYQVDSTGNLVKYIDNGKTVEEKYFITPEPLLCYLGGISLSKGLIWGAARGPGPGPFWDSGGGGEIALFFDNSQSLSLVTRIGTPGQNTDPIEFLNPRATAMTPDHKHLYVAEDGLPNTDGPPGNARISRFKIKANLEDSAPIQIGK
jgi:DNA-binding beta-propeller fold protein YncE